MSSKRILEQSRRVLTAFALCVAGAVAAQTADIPNKHEPLPGITTAGQPSAANLEAAAKAGYKTVIDLRALTEDRGFDERATVERLGMSYVSLPVDGAAGITYENAHELDRLLADLPKPVLLHCASANRAGALLALRAKSNGADSAAALELGVASGLTSLKPTVEKRLTEAPK
jgi:uncharacterized protein (TIGR01244 family)